MAKKALLMILDGWGIGKHNHGDVIYETPTPFMDHLNATYPHSQLLACGENVGLPAEQYAIQTGQHPAVTTETNIKRYREQLDKKIARFCIVCE